jgi:hypothetical protein
MSKKISSKKVYTIYGINASDLITRVLFLTLVKSLLEIFNHILKI